MTEMIPERMEDLQGGGLCGTLAGVAAATYTSLPTTSTLAWGGYTLFCRYPV